jgi:hypothetical protein
MTDYHPVTKEELDMIKNDCAHSETNACDGCEYEGKSDHNPITSFNPCTFKGANALMDEVLSRPDPLTLLEAWRKSRSSVFDYVKDENEFINQLRTNPEAVRQRGIKEGWWK